MNTVRIRALATASLAAVVMGSAVQVPAASAAAPAARAATVTTPEPPPLPDVEHVPWDGTTGIELTVDPRVRQLVADVAAMHPLPQMRDAAQVALDGDETALRRFLSVTQPQIQTQEADRLKRVAQQNTRTIQAMVGTGGAFFNDEVNRVLRATDADREAFLAYGADIARQRDEKLAEGERQRRAQLRDRLGLLVTATAPESNVRRAAEAAIAGDDAAVAAFWATGYTQAAAADAAERERYLRDLEARNKAAEDASELARRATQAAQARTRLLAAHGEGVDALQRAANDMIGAGNAARRAEQILAGTASTATKTAELNAAKDQAAAFLRGARQAATSAQTSAATANAAAATMQDVGLDYGAEWARITQGLYEAATAAVGATETATHAIDATLATHHAQTAQARAEAHARQAVQWRKHAQDHARAAAQLAAATEAQARAAKTAAERTKTARVKAEQATAQAWAAAERVRQQRAVAEAEAKKAKEARSVAERERAAAANHRANAERHAATARNARAYADSQAAIADGARQRSEAAEDDAERAWNKSTQDGQRAKQHRDAAIQAKRERDAEAARAHALRSKAAQADTEADRAEAQRQADEADRQAGVARGAADNAQGAADRASGAAASSRAEAMQAQQAADRAWAAATAAIAAAERADAAADKAEADAKVTHSARLRADAQAAVATVQETRAAEAANSAVGLAQRAADEAIRAFWAAERTRDEADAAVRESVAASVQADHAVTAATAARTSSAGIAEPYNTALSIVAPFSGADIDADFVTQVAEQARIIGNDQAEAARRRAAEAVTAAVRAERAAEQATGQIKEAFNAAAQAARSASAAATSAAEAKQAAAEAAADGAKARAAALDAGKADAQAKADAAAARNAANEAATDADIAGRNAAAAQRDADQANSAAGAAEADAAAARDAAARADVDARSARAAADGAQQYADAAAVEASNALRYAVEAEKAADEAEAEQRERLNAALASSQGVDPAKEGELLDGMTAEQRAEYERMKELAAKGIMDFIQEEGLDFLKGLIVPEDLDECLRTPNFKACFWTVFDAIPWTKWRKLGNVWDLYKKFEKFADRTQDSRKRRDELQKAAEALLECRKKRGNSSVAGVRALTAAGSPRSVTYVVAAGTPVQAQAKAQDEGGWKITPERSTAAMRGGPFGAMYYKQVKDSKGNVYWWSPDKAGHGQSAWKVFRETSTGLEWVTDADENGTFMPDKHKGEKGKFVAWKDLKTVKVKGLGSAVKDCER